jgi:hypothetical protein
MIRTVCQTVSNNFLSTRMQGEPANTMHTVKEVALSDTFWKHPGYQQFAIAIQALFVCSHLAALNKMRSGYGRVH